MALKNKRKKNPRKRKKNPPNTGILLAASAAVVGILAAVGISKAKADKKKDKPKPKPDPDPDPDLDDVDDDDPDDLPPPPPPPPPASEFSPFDNAQQVQEALISLHFSVGSSGADGIWGSKSRKGLQQFIKVANSVLGTSLVVTGNPNPQNMQLLADAMTLDAGGGWPTPGEIENILKPTPGPTPKFEGGWSSTAEGGEGVGTSWTIKKPGPNWQWRMAAHILQNGQTIDSVTTGQPAASRQDAARDLALAMHRWFDDRDYAVEMSQIEEEICATGVCD